MRVILMGNSCVVVFMGCSCYLARESKNQVKLEGVVYFSDNHHEDISKNQKGGAVRTWWGSVLHQLEDIFF